jgi:hypothetical protein
VREQGRNQHESRVEVVRASRGGSGVREQGWLGACTNFSRMRSPLLPRTVSLSFPLPPARTLLLSRPCMLARSFFPSPGRLNRHEATLRDTSPAKATPYSPKSWRHRRLCVALATPQGRLKIYGPHLDAASWKPNSLCRHAKEVVAVVAIVIIFIEATMERQNPPFLLTVVGEKDDELNPHHQKAWHGENEP